VKHTRKALVFLILLVTPLLLSGVIIPVFQEDWKTVVTQSPVKSNVPSYEEISPITAIGDGELNAYATAHTWDGDGSPGNPFIIEGYNITANENCIDIADVSLAFEIRDCYFYSAPEAIDPDNGINIVNATQVLIYNTTILYKNTGIQVFDTPALTIENCTIDEVDEGIFLYNCSGTTIHESLICDVSSNDGIDVRLSNNTMFSNNIIHDCELNGIRLDESYFTTVIENEIYSNQQSGMLVQESDNCTIENNVIYDNMFFTGPECGIYLDSSDGASIVGNEIYDNSQNGIFMTSSDWVYIFENHIYNNSDHGIDAVGSNIGTIIQNNIHGNGFWPVFVNALCGIFLGSSSDDWYISENTIWNNTPAGITVEFADDIQISNNEIYNNTNRGIFGNSFGVNEDLRILENEIYGNGFDVSSGGIILYGYENCTIERNQIYNNTGNGILSHGSYNNITDNEVYDTIGNGINIEMTSQNNVFHNTAYDNTEAGIFVYSTNVEILYNLIYDNGIGIHLYGSSSCNLYGNDIGWNTANALEEYGLNNNVWYATFDDFGNHWHDYVPPTGEGIDRYAITNGTHSVAFDNKPDMSLNLTDATPISYEILETGNVLIWEAYALNPGNYFVWVDSVYQYSEVWDGGDIELNVDEFAHGFYEIMLSASHISGHMLAYDSNVTVEDLTAPSAIDGPTNITSGIGTPISFSYTSEDPSGITWAVDDTTNFTISSTGVLTNATYLPVGLYVIEISATDPYGHSTTLIVSIRVSLGTTIPPPTELLLLFGGAGAIIILAVAVVVYKRKQG